MADITMCNDKECDRKDICYRYTAKPNEYRQSYFGESPKQEGLDGEYCTYFWDTIKGK